MKVQKQIQTVTPFAGISFVIKEFNSCGLSSLIDNILGIRSLSGYQYSDIIRGWFSVFFSGGDVAEDINCHLYSSLACIPGNRVPSADFDKDGDEAVSKKEYEAEEEILIQYILHAARFCALLSSKN
ncbi:MAG: hypothetical protein LBU37_14745 [Tannerellaceae bacterium]|jgi:hypothetical protein|nr:hypothetical protein [Tannerellaceae bacterium]